MSSSGEKGSDMDRTADRRKEATVRHYVRFPSPSNLRRQWRRLRCNKMVERRQRCVAGFGLLLRRTCDGGGYEDFVATERLKGDNSVPLRSVPFSVEPAAAVEAMETSESQDPQD
ncbi:hypothetical protein SESBI_36163, partial [Sesbania bispinosa]